MLFKIKLSIHLPAEQAHAEGGLWGLEPLPLFKIIQKCPSRTNSNDIVVNKTKFI